MSKNFKIKQVNPANTGPDNHHHETKKSKKLTKQEQSSKLHLKAHFQQRQWPLTDEGHKGRKI